MSKGFVYILTNPCLDGWTKIGMTEKDDIDKRLSELNSPSNLPLSYRCYATYEVEDPREVEKKIHSLIDQIDGSLRAREQLSNGRIREREFFKFSPETAYAIFRDVASLRGDAENLKIYVPTPEQSQEQEIADSKTQRSNNTFNRLNIAVGEEIVFLYDDTITAKVIDEKNQVEYKGESYSVTKLARKLLTEYCRWTTQNVNGWRFFTKNGVLLNDLRDSVEISDENDD